MLHEDKLKQFHTKMRKKHHTSMFVVVQFKYYKTQLGTTKKCPSSLNKSREALTNSS